MRDRRGQAAAVCMVSVCRVGLGNPVGLPGGGQESSHGWGAQAGPCVHTCAPGEKGDVWEKTQDAPWTGRGKRSAWKTAGAGVHSA